MDEIKNLTLREYSEILDEIDAQIGEASQLNEPEKSAAWSRIRDFVKSERDN